MLRILHTSDWHLGRMLHDRSRDDEFDAFLAWLLATIEEHRIDVLLVAGDVFDTSNASHGAQQKYYDFCVKLNRTCCRHAVVTSGNHDSTSFIDVPGNLLRSLRIHAVGQARFGVHRDGCPADEVIVLKDTDGNDELIVAAVPFLSDGDIRISEAGEDNATREEKMRAGMALHYALVADEAERIRAGRNIPVVAMGHMFVTGGKLIEDGSERQTYVGTLGGVSESIFSPKFDYVALGHLHVPQIVGNHNHIRYSGSPIAMGFGEAGQQKSVCLIEFDGKKTQISQIDVPCFHKMARVQGDKDEIRTQLQTLMAEREEVYVAVTYTGRDYFDNIKGYVNEILGESSHVLCLWTQDKAITNDKVSQTKHVEKLKLSDITEQSVFQKLMETKCPDQSDEEKQALMATFLELLVQVKEQQ